MGCLLPVTVRAATVPESSLQTDGGKIVRFAVGCGQIGVPVPATISWRRGCPMRNTASAVGVVF